MICARVDQDELGFGPAFQEILSVANLVQTDQSGRQPRGRGCTKSGRAARDVINLVGHLDQLVMLLGRWRVTV